MSPATVLYVEVPGFYAEVERLAHPELAGRPILVGGDPRKGGSVQSASREARAAGIREGMGLFEALERCPTARRFRTDMRRYRECSARLRATLRRRVERLEPAGLGAAYLDGSVASGPPEALADALRERVEEELGLPLCVGISAAKFLARLALSQAMETAAPGDSAAVFRVADGEEARFLAPLGVERLPGVGPTTAARLSELGAQRVGELARLDRAVVEAALGAHGRTIWELAHGRDASRVRPAAHPKSLSQESSFSAEERDTAVLLVRLKELSEGLAASLAREELRARRVTLKVRYADAERVSRSCTLDAPLAAAGEIHARVASLLERTQAGERPVRGLGIVLGALAPEAREDHQLELFGRDVVA